MWNSLPTLAGTFATIVFACGTLPMLGKAVRSKDLTSYSTGNLVLANVGNAFYSVYVFHLPPGPVWFLHGFYLVSSGLMLFWNRRYAPTRAVHEPTHAGRPRMGIAPDAAAASRS
jgi:uncharacterized protein with PQ loop repeat